MSDAIPVKPQVRTFYRKRIGLFALLEKIKIWPSRKGVLHGIKTIVSTGTHARITTHCGKSFTVTNSKNSRAARWLRNKWHKGACESCAVPEWKLKKFAVTFFRNGYGADLREGPPHGPPGSP